MAATLKVFREGDRTIVRISNDRSRVLELALPPAAVGVVVALLQGNAADPQCCGELDLPVVEHRERV